MSALQNVDLTRGEILLLEDVAERYGVAVSTVQEWARRGRLPCFKPPGTRRVFVKLRDLEAWEDGCELETKRLADGGRIVKPVRHTTTTRRTT
jgi:excisionase family DNA binding protein